jgi:hypothetical protein
MKLKTILIGGLSLLAMGTYTSCTDMMDTTSKLVMFSQDHKLDQATDTVYSVMGIIGKMQAVADQTVLLGEIRGDLVELTQKASVDLQELAQFNVSGKNAYRSATPYFAVINNCNYYLAHVDTSLKKRNEYVFMKEFAAVKTFRAWTYLQLAMTYGNVPFITEPILTEAAANKNYPMKSIKEICDYFIDDIKPYVNTPFPGYGAINVLDSKKFFLPVRVVLGDLCLWAERYQESAMFYHDYLTDESNPITTGVSQIIWPNTTTSFNNTLNTYTSLFSNVGNTEIISYIPMESTSSEKAYSQLPNVFNSTIQNNYFNQATPSARLLELSKAQSNCILFGVKDTLFAPVTNTEKPLWVGDLRLSSIYLVTNGLAGTNDGNSTTSNLYSTKRQTISKYTTGHVVLYRRGQIYLRFAEAMNRAGYPEAAFAVLKYGLYPATINRYVNARERTEAGNLLNFSQYAFSYTNTLGIHARGSGDPTINKYYKIEEKPNLNDSIDFVENLICDEMALETSFEGGRFFDLVRMAIHKGNNEWLAKKIATRKGSANEDAILKGLLLDRSKWFLPLN